MKLGAPVAPACSLDTFFIFSVFFPRNLEKESSEENIGYLFTCQQVCISTSAFSQLLPKTYHSCFSQKHGMLAFFYGGTSPPPRETFTEIWSENNRKISVPIEFAIEICITIDFLPPLKKFPEESQVYRWHSHILFDSLMEKLRNSPLFRQCPALASQTPILILFDTLFYFSDTASHIAHFRHSDC